MSQAPASSAVPFHENYETAKTSVEEAFGEEVQWKDRTSRTGVPCVCTPKDYHGKSKAPAVLVDPSTASCFPGCVYEDFSFKAHDTPPMSPEEAVKKAREMMANIA